MSLTAAELFDGIGASDRFSGRVHWVSGMPFAGTPGHLYFFRQRRSVSSANLAAISHRSGDVEVCLMRMDGIPIIYIGSRGIAVATVFVPPTDIGIDTYEWVAHTHPLEMETPYEGVAEGPTRADRQALETIHERWGQTQSTVVVCRGGRVEREVTFSIERDGRTPPHTGRLWTPTD
jgi:hypothetical protein